MKGRLTILLSENGAKIELRDCESRVKFLELEIDPVNFTAALGRLAEVECEFQLNAENVGKTFEKSFIDFYTLTTSKENATKEANKLIEILNDKWILRDTFSSKDSFIYDSERKEYKCRANIIRYK